FLDRGFRRSGPADAARGGHGAGADGGPWLVLTIGRIAVGRDDLVTAMAGHRLVDDVRTPGRVAAVMFTVGVAFGLIAQFTSSVLDGADRHDVAFYLGGVGAAAVGTLLAALVATFSLVVGATEQ